MNKSKKISRISFVLILIIILSTSSSFAFAQNDNLGENVQNRYIPLWMKPNTIIVYGSSSEYTIVQGGKLTKDDIVDRVDITTVGLTTTSPDMIIQPNIKVEYDNHGFIQNIYYAVPGSPGQYQLKNPSVARNGTGWLSAGQSYSYGNYLNYDTHTYNTNLLQRQAGALQIQGWGRITFYTGTYGETGPSHPLQYYDCATKMYYDDVPSGTTVYAMNTYVSGINIVTFYKWDCGGLPAAVLDVWSDSSFNPITTLTTSGTIDNVYSAYIWNFPPN